MAKFLLCFFLNSTAFNSIKTDTTWCEENSSWDENSENLNPNVTKVINLRSGLVASKDGITKKFVVESVRTPKHKLANNRIGAIAENDCPPIENNEVVAESNISVDSDGSSESNTSIVPNESAFELNISVEQMPNGNDEPPEPKTPVELANADEQHLVAGHVADAPPSASIELAETDEMTVVPQTGEENLQIQVDEFSVINEPNMFDFDESLIANIAQDLMSGQISDFGQYGTDRPGSQTNNSSFGFPGPSTQIASVDPFVGLASGMYGLIYVNILRLSRNYSF